MSFYLTHLHSAYSFSDSLITAKRLAGRLQELNMNKVAITDHGNLLHIQEYRQVLQKNNIQHFPGCEFYYCNDIDDKQQRRSFHLTAIAKTEQGVKNLYTLSSLSYEKGLYYRPRIDFNLLQQYNEGISFSSACLAGQLDRLLLEDKPLEALEVAKKFKTLLGERFFIEIMPHNIPEQQTVNPLLIELAQKLNIKLITTCDSHYVYQDEASNRRMLMMMNKSGWAKDEEVGACETIYMMSKDDIKNTFKMFHNIDEKILDEAIENTSLMLDGEAPNVVFDKARFPNFEIPKEFNSEEEYFNNLIVKGLRDKKLIDKSEYLERVKKEVQVIKNAGFINYFLVEYDLFNWCRTNRIYTGVARGSAGGSLVAYLLNITRIDPLKYDLLFERFYNEGRNTGTAENCPDIDSDFESSRREEVIKYLENKYGSENVSQICNINYIKLKSGIKDVARVLNIPIDVSNKISQDVDWESYKDLDEAIEVDNRAKAIVEKYPELFKYVKIFCGIPRQTGKHAAGIVIGDQKIGNICPMMLATVDGEKFLVSQFDKESIKYTGLIKFDILGLTTMDFIHAIDEEVKKETGRYVEWDKIPLDDKNIYEFIYGRADTDYVFQCDTDSMKNLLLKMQCKNIEDVAAMNTLARPASLVSGATNRYIEKRFSYIHKKFSNDNSTSNDCEADRIFNEITKNTYGEIIYDEQKMRMVQQIGGLSLKDANLVRKEVKKWANKHDELQTLFLKNALSKGWDNEKAKLYWEMVKQYSFCKAHSIAYSILGYWCAYTKYYYPVAFMKAMFSIASTDANTSKFNVIDAIKFARKLGYNILPVNVNKSKSVFAFDDIKKEIYFPFRSIKGVSEVAGKIIEEKAPFKDFEDFLIKAKAKEINKRIITPLIELRGFKDLACDEQIKKYFIDNFALPKEEDSLLRDSIKVNKEARLLTKEERKIYKQKVSERAVEEFDKMYNSPLSFYELKNLGLILTMDLEKYKDKQILKRKPEEVEEGEKFFLYGFLSELKILKSKKGSYYGYIELVDENFNKYEIITRSTTIDNIEQRQQYRVEFGQYIKAEVIKKEGNRYFLEKENIIALEDC